MKHCLAIKESQHDFLCPPSSLLPHNQACRSAGNTVSTSIIRAVWKRTKGFYRSYFMKSSWCDTDGRREGEIGCWKVLQTKKGDCLEEMGQNMVQHRRRDRGQGGRGETMGKGCREREKGEFTIHDRRAILTVGNTLILDLQVFVGPWAGVGEDI